MNELYNSNAYIFSQAACRTCNVMSTFVKDASQQALDSTRPCRGHARAESLAEDPERRDTGHNALKHARTIDPQQRHTAP
jgi:hypothetical protein